VALVVAVFLRVVRFMPCVRVMCFFIRSRRYRPGEG
jgi:hypothetical protein